MINQTLFKSIDAASKEFGKTYPLYSFVTSNPLSGYERIPFMSAAEKANQLYGSNFFPDASFYRQALEQGAIDTSVLRVLLKEQGLTGAPEKYLSVLESLTVTQEKNTSHDVDRITAKWLASFMDEGLAEWEMPFKEEGFYQAWRKLAVFDDELGFSDIHEIPETSTDCLLQLLSNYSVEDYKEIFSCHMASLPGWTGYIKFRMDNDTSWQIRYPITLQDYLAVRLLIAKQKGAEIFPKPAKSTLDRKMLKLQYLWLKAWERTWQKDLVGTLKESNETGEFSKSLITNPHAQLVFCIDTRSEAIRKHIESKGPYETFGYAGFFGIAMDYENLNDGLTRKSCPPILASSYKVSEFPVTSETHAKRVYEKKKTFLNFWEFLLRRMKNMLPSAFGYVEGSGLIYGISLIFRTIMPNLAHRIQQTADLSYEGICEPEIFSSNLHKGSSQEIPLEEKVAIVKSAFELTGWKKFAPIVLFVGHASRSANNPLGSSLDCGACAASPGRHNARMLAKLANLPEVRKALKADFNLEIPPSTVFLGAEHNTTTDEIVIFDANLPDAHCKLLRNLKEDLHKARLTALAERLGVKENGITLADKKANDWAETRPEWGLAKNAGFIIAPRNLTKSHSLDSRCFLHSYDWKLDKNGQALEGIMQGPMVVTQWINNHYYFSTVNNGLFGGGSKITQNVVGNFGVLQGNGGDLKMGLPLQSLQESDTAMYHQPLRLSVLIQAPLSRVEAILLRNEQLTSLLDNEWIYLMVLDPLADNLVCRYHRGMEWIPVQETAIDRNEPQPVFQGAATQETVTY